MALLHELGDGSLQTIGPPLYYENASGTLVEIGTVYRELGDGTLVAVWNKPAAPANPSGSTTDCDGSTSIELTFTDNSEYETKWNVYRDGSFWDTVSSSTKSSTGSVTITANGPIASGGTYTFTVQAENADGVKSDISTGGADITFPNAPGSPTTPSLTFYDGGSSSSVCGDLVCGVEITWSLADTRECGVRVYRDDGSGFTEIADLAAGSTEYCDTQISENTSYSYYVEAYNDIGSASSSENSITTGTCDTGTT